MIRRDDLFVTPCHGGDDDDNTVPEEAKRKYLRVRADDELYRGLQKDPAAAWRVLESEGISPARTLEGRIQVRSLFCAILKFCLDEKRGRRILLDARWSGALWCVVLDPRRWHLIHDHCDASWVDCIGVVGVVPKPFHSSRD